jgi:succinoglycan biosynthesis protein ExoA
VAKLRTQRDYPGRRGSTDATVSVLERFSARHSQMAVRVLARPDVRIPVATSEGISSAAGAIIVRLDAHSSPEPDYVERVTRLLPDTGGGVAGGRWRIEPGAQTTLARAIALGVQHLLGSGDAAYRAGSGTTPGAVDTVPFDCFEKSTWARVGGYNQELAANEDYDFNYRVRRAGGKVLAARPAGCVGLHGPINLSGVGCSVSSLRMVEGRDAETPSGGASLAPGAAAGVSRHPLRLGRRRA